MEVASPKNYAGGWGGDLKWPTTRFTETAISSLFIGL